MGKKTVGAGGRRSEFSIGRRAAALLVTAVRGAARRSVLVQNPYFVPDDMVREALVHAARPTGASRTQSSSRAPSQRRTCRPISSATGGSMFASTTSV